MSSRSALVASPPLRRCVACRRQDRKDALVRFAVTQTGQLRVDGRQAALGRGAYVCPRQACADRALEKGAARLWRSLRTHGQSDAAALRVAFHATVSRRRAGDAAADQGERT